MVRMVKDRSLGKVGYLPFYLFTCLIFLASCGTDNGRFRLEGRLRNINQGEFYVYSPDGAIEGFDTIKVSEGRFSYETAVNDRATLVVVFPNFSEQPVFAESGTEVTIKGDASHMKEMTIKGTDDNDEMTKLRMNLNRLMPPEIPGAVEAFIREHLESPVSIYLLKRYFVLDRQPDYKKALALTRLMLKQQPESGQLIMLEKQLKDVQTAQDKRLPKFTATDVKGQKVSEQQLKSQVNVVSLWASWNYQSTDIQRRLQRLKKEHGDKLSVLSICIDGRPSECKRTVERDSLKWPTVCDGRMWQTPLLAKFGFSDVPGNVIYDGKGNVLERNLNPQDLENKLVSLLK